MPRPREFLESDVVSSAGEVLAVRGPAAATPDDLVRATGPGKQSSYNAFGGKRELFFRALPEDREEATRAVSEALGHDDASPLERIRGHMLLMAIEFGSTDRRVSLTTRALVESTGEQDPLSTAAKTGIEQLAGVHARCLEHARENEDLPEDANVQSPAVYFVATTRGMELLGRAGVGRSVLTAVALDALRVLHGRRMEEADDRPSARERLPTPDHRRDEPSPAGPHTRRRIAPRSRARKVNGPGSRHRRPGRSPRRCARGHLPTRPRRAGRGAE
ncbi:TetR/AcrR family transcriptional regulator [Umezawaea beigongshangensis]|uniref:TetR/AcrR family transcriptional regulator n=1 Tax=Umezawaea beigongshangensis TaxID=2780383 RepID=UPI0018F1FA46|nr:TetR/AcrR family transcriptional regulator [Umezawaea beigongshangensis]